MHFVFPFNVEVKAEATSNVSRELILARLAELDGFPESADKEREVAFLEQALQALA